MINAQKAIPRMTVNRFVVAAGIVATVALATACGQRSGNDTTPVTPAPQQTQAGTIAPANTAAPATAAKTTNTTRVTDTTRSGSTTTSRSPSSTVVANAKDPSNSEFCMQFASVINETQGKFNQVESEAQFAELLDEIKRAYQGLADAAPAPIKQEWTTANAAIQQATTQTMLALEDDPSFKAAIDRIGEWTIANCGFNPDS